LNRGGGFTLLEVLVALVVVAVAVAALAHTGARALNGQSRLEQQTVALWVADNALAELRLETAVPAGRRRGTTTMAGRAWEWELFVQPAPGGELLRADVLVYAGHRSDAPVLQHTGFLAP